MEKVKFIRNTEDWWALWIGLFVFLLSLGPMVGRDLLGFGVAPSVCVSLEQQRPPGYSGFIPPRSRGCCTR